MRLSITPNPIRPGAIQVLLLLVIAAVTLTPVQVMAALKSWNGSVSGNWNTSSNWDPAGVPVNGDDLIFPSLVVGAAKTMTNNIPSPARRFRSITFSDGGYILRGNAVAVTNNLSSISGVGANTVEIDVTLGANQTWLNNSPLFTVSGDINLAGFNLTLDASDAGEFFILSGAISGTGNLTKLGAGFLNLSGITANTYAGSLTISAGELRLAKSDGVTAVPGAMTLAAGASARWFADNLVADTAPVTVGNGGSLTLNNNNETLGLLDLTGAAVSTTTGTLTMNGDLTNRASATSTVISGNLNLGSFSRTFGVANGTATDDLSIPATVSGGSRIVGSPFGILVFAGMIKHGDGRLVLAGTNTFGGGYTSNDGLTRADSDGAFGTVPLLGLGGTVTVNPGGQITLNDANIAAHALIINQPSPSAAMTASGISSWSGVVTLNTNATFTTGGTLSFSNRITGVGDLELASSVVVVTFRFAGTNGNDFDGDVILTDGTLELAKVGGSLALAIPNDLIIGDPGDSGSTKTVRYLGNAQMDGSVTINCAGVLDLNNRADSIRSVTMSGGAITTGTGTLTINGNLNVLAEPAPCSDNTINGEIAFLGGAPRFINMPAGSVVLGAPDLIVNAVISSTSSVSTPELVVSGNSGRVFFNGANSYTNTLRLQSTTGGLQVRMNNPAAFGSASRATTLDGVQLILGGFNFAAEPITNVNPGTVIQAIGNNFHAGPIVLNADLLFINTAAITEFAGAIIGPGDLRKAGAGTLRFSGAGVNTFGTLFVHQGLFEMDKNAGVTAANSLVIGDGVNTATARNFQSSQTDGVTVNRGSLWDLNGNNDTITPLVLDNGGDVSTGAGTLSFGAAGSITVTGGSFGLGTSSSTISGNLNLGAIGTRTISVVERAPFLIGTDPTELIINAIVSGAAAINKTGAGDLSLTGANTFTGNVTVSDGELLISNDTALGTAAGGTFVNGDALLDISGDIVVLDEALTLNSTGQAGVGAVHNTGGTNAWSGPVSLTQTAVINVVGDTWLRLSGIISGAGGITKSGQGVLQLGGPDPNTYAGTTVINEGRLIAAKLTSRAIPGNVIVGDGVGGTDADVLQATPPGTQQIGDSARVTVNSSGLFSVEAIAETVGSLGGAGNLRLANASLETGGNGESTTFDGEISSSIPSSFLKAGTGTMTLNGVSPDHVCATRVSGGTLIVNGNQQNSFALVESGATLGGGGRVAGITVNNLGNLSPGSSPGVLTANGNATLSPGSNFRVEINGPDPGTGYDRLSVNGTVNLNGAQLIVTKGPGIAPFEGQEFAILVNDGADLVVGTFAGRPNGSIITINQLDFHLSYVGGTGNDVTLTVTNTGLRFASARVESGNGNGVVDPDECDHLFVALENRTGLTISGVSARLDSLTPGVAVTQSDAAYPNIPALGFRTNTAPFQIRIAPDFECGQPIRLSLVVTATGEGTFAVPFTLPSGSAGVTRNFGSTNVPKAVISLQSTNSLIEVPFQFRIAKVVRVSLHVTHPSAGDLRLSLISPSGTVVNLSTNHGGAGNNYGAACNNRAIFDDDAPVRIATAAAPFAGEFTPDEPLSRFNGEFSAGIWRLRVEDTVAGDDGAIQCWTLGLIEADCTGGGGGCESCITVAGTLAPGAPTMPQRIFRTQTPSGCGNVKPCPGGTTVISVPPYRYNTHVFTNTGPAACVTAMLSVPCAESTNALISAAYLDTFNPGDLCENYLGDGGISLSGGSAGYSFRVPAGARFVVMVQEVNPSAVNSGCGTYTLQLYGLPCPPPTLHIARDAGPDRVRLFWSTAYPGFQLQRSPTLNGEPPFPFVNVPGVPFVIGGDYTVTNTATADDDYFRLRKP